MDFNINLVVSRLSGVIGVAAIALGGSRSRDEAAAASDYDIGLYYDNADISLSELDEAVRDLDDNHRPDRLNRPGAWGPWINGGCWLTVGNTPVDILLREISQVKSVLDDCLAGQITIDYQCGHPFGFVNAIYAAETHCCIPLWQNDNHPLDGLKAYLHSQGNYPPLMKSAMIRKFMWEARFSLDCAIKPALRGDFNYAAGSVFRTVCAWAEVLYAVNEVYMMNEKGSLRQLEHMNIKPHHIEARVKEAYASLSADCAQRGFEVLEDIHKEIESLTI